MATMASDHADGFLVPAAFAEELLPVVQQALRAELDDAEAKAWQSLARYKFQMFGYWAAIWVHLNRVGRFRRPNPWKGLVNLARATDTGPGL